MHDSEQKLKEKLRKSKALLFDMDGIVTDTMPWHCSSWIKAFRDFFHINVSENEIYEREGEKSEKSVKEILTKHNIISDDKEISIFLKYKSEIFTKSQNLPLFKDMGRLLLYLKKYKILALVTGTPMHELKGGFPERIFNLFDIVVTSTDTSKGKPHPEPYLKALAHLNIMNHDALVIENAPYGIESAISAKIEVIAIPTSLPVNKLKNATYICSNHQHFYNLIYSEVK